DGTAEIFYLFSCGPSALKSGKAVLGGFLHAGSCSEVDPADLCGTMLFEFCNGRPIKSVGCTQGIAFFVHGTQVAISDAGLNIPKMHSDSSPISACLKNHKSRHFELNCK